MIDDNFKASNWCDQEAGIAFGMDKFIVPVRLGFDPYGFIGKFQGIQGKGKLPKKMAEEIYSLLISAEKTKKKLAEGIIEMFVSSKSYKEARDGVVKLRQIRYINESLIKKLEKGLTENSQIRDAIGVPEKIRQLIRSLSDL